MSDQPLNEPPLNERTLSERNPTERPGNAGRPRTEAVEKRGRWPGLVWAVPLAALIIVGYLGLQAISQRGVTVVVTFSSSGFFIVWETKVIYKGVTVGHVVHIAIAPDGKHVDMALRLTPLAKPVLRDTAKFWLIGAQPSLTDFSSIKAAVSGVTIGISPGTGAPRRRFTGLDRPPPVPPDTPGAFYVLHGEQIGQTQMGAGVFYHGLEVGRVTTIDIASAQLFKLGVFIQAPYDRLVRPDTLFYLANAVDVSLSGSSISADLGPGNSALAGGIEFDTPQPALSKGQSPAGSAFDYYVDKAHAANAPRGPLVLYDAIFTGGGGQLAALAPVKLAGFSIGEVVQRRLNLVNGAPVSQVTLEIEPLKLLDGASPPLDGNWRKLTDTTLNNLFSHGYRLTMAQDPPLLGQQALLIGPVARSGAAAITYGGLHPKLPTGKSADVAALTDTASAILDKVNAVPIEAIGQDVRKITDKLGQFANSPQLADSLNHLNSTLDAVDRTVKQVQPQVGPLIAKLNLAADQLQATAASANAVLSGDGSKQDSSLPEAIHQLTDAGRSIRSLADYLGRHPEAIIRGKAKDAK